jgi:integrase
MTKSQAKTALAAIVAQVNARRRERSPEWLFGDLVGQVYLPFYRRKWKRSTVMCNEQRIKYHLTAELGKRELGSFRRDELQDLLDRKAGSGLSYSVVAHLRWDLRQIFGMAVAEGFLQRNPAELLFVPRECPRPNIRVMTLEEVRKLFLVLDMRERLIARLAIGAGMRPGEIFGLQWGRLDKQYADIRQRVYRGDVDSPKSVNSVRWAALSDGLLVAIQEWRELSPSTALDAWVFPSETFKTPLGRDNCWRRHFRPKLAAIGLGWATFHVFRRTHSSLLRDLGIDAKVRAEQMGHTVDVNENVYTRTSLESRREAVNALESALLVM